MSSLYFWSVIGDQSVLGYITVTGLVIFIFSGNQARSSLNPALQHLLTLSSSDTCPAVFAPAVFIHIWLSLGLHISVAQWLQITGLRNTEKKTKVNLSGVEAET